MNILNGVFFPNYGTHIHIYVHTYIHTQIHTYIKTHDSESRGQEEAGLCDEPVIINFTGSTAVNFVNALNKPPLKLSLSYQGLSTF